MFKHGWIPLAAAAVIAGSLPAQLSKGAPAPEFKFEKVWNGGPESFADLAGKVVILDFAETW